MESAGKSKAVNVLGVIGNVFLSILFVIVAFIVPIYYSIAGMLEPKSITTVIQKIDYVAVLQESEEVNQTFKEIGLDAKTTDELIKSKEVGAMLEDFSGEMTTVLSDPNADLDSVDAAFVNGFVDKHIDDIMKVVEKKAGSPVKKDNVKKELSKVIENKDAEIKETASSLRPIKEKITSFSTVTKTIQAISKWYYVLAICVLEILLLALIYFIRRKNFGGFVWIAVDVGIVGSLVSCVAAVVGSGLVKSIISQIPGFLGGMVASAAKLVATKLVIALVVCFVIMALSVAACIVLRTMKRKNAGEPEMENAEEKVIEETVNA